MTASRILKKILKVLMIIIMSVLALAGIFLIFIHLPVGRKITKNQVQKYLKNKLNTEVRIGSIDYSLPEWVEIKNIYVEDQKKDTLLYGEELKVDLKLLKLLRGNTDIQKAYLKNILVNINRPEGETAFNFEFIVNAFTGNKKTTANPDTAALKLTLDHLILDRVAVRFKDVPGGNSFVTKIDSLDATLTRFQPDRLQFDITKFYANGIDFFMGMTKPTLVDSTSFNSGNAAAPTSNSLWITAGNFNLANIDVAIDDEVSGMFYSNDVHRLKLTNATLDLAGYKGIADSLVLDSSRVKFVSPKIPDDKVSTSAPAPWLFKAKLGLLTHNSFQFDDNNVVATGGLDFSHLDLSDIRARIEDFQYSDSLTKANIYTLALKDKSGFVLDSGRVDMLFTDTILSAQNLFLKTAGSVLQNGIEIRYDSLGAITSHPENTLITANFNNSQIAFNDLHLVFPFLKETFPPATFANQVVRINTELRGTLKRVYLPHIQLSGLSGSTVNARGTLFNLNNPEKFSYDLVIINSRILKQDMLRFIPPENLSQFQQLPPEFALSGNIRGSKNDLDGVIRASGNGIDFAGKIALNNISNPERLEYDVTMERGTFSRDFIMGFIPAGTLPEGFQIPERIVAEGMIGGSTNDVKADARLQTSFGNASVKGFLKNYSDPQKANYDLDINLVNFDLGKLSGQDSLVGEATGHVLAKGTGLDYKTMVADLSGDIRRVELNGYDYNNIVADIKLNRGEFSAEGSVDDSALKLKTNLTGNLSGDYPIVRGLLRVDTARLNALGLYPDSLDLAFTAEIDADNLRPRQMAARLLIDSINFKLRNERYPLDSILLQASSLNGVDSITLTSNVANGYVAGAFDYDKVIPAIMQYVDSYYDIGVSDSSTYPDQQINFSASIQSHPLISAFVPDLTDYKGLDLQGRFRTADLDSALSLQARAAQIQYGTNSFTNALVDIKSQDGKINYAASADTISAAGKYFYGTRVNGNALKDSLVISAVTQDESKRDWFGVKGSVGTKDGTYTISLRDTVLMNYEYWEVAPDNYIRYGDEGIIVHNLSLTSDTARLIVKSQEEIPNSAIDVSVDNFNIRSISSFINPDTLFMEGILDSRLTIDDLDNQVPTFTGYAYVSGFKMMGQPIGELEFYAANRSDELVSTRIYLTGNGNDVSASANYNLVSEVLDAKVDVTRLNAATLTGLSAGQLKYASGSIRGNMDIYGLIGDPHWNGQLNFDTTRFALTEFGAPYQVNDQQITLAYPNIRLDNFTISDSLGNEMKVNGDVTARTLTRYDFDLGVKADDFIVLNVQKAIANELYGFASVDADIHIGGNSEAPDIEGDVLLNDNSDVTIVLPERNFDKDASKSIVRFVDMDTMGILQPGTGFSEKEASGPVFAKFLNYNLNLEVRKDAIMRIIVDPVTGDEMVVQGDAQLNAGVDPGGNIVLAGNYILDKGSYVLNYQFLQRRFNLQKGSTITFVGEPMNARVDVTAEYIANSSSRDLLANEVTSADPALANSFNQKIPFRVIMHLTGVLSQPTIKFDIQLPDEESNIRIHPDLKATIESKLAQIRGDESATNKQVFSLLLFNRFISEQSSDFFKGNENGFNDLARQSVSQFLSSALNEIANDLIKGVDIDLSLNSYQDYSGLGSSQRTDLNLQLSKSFMNDRLVVTVGKNFGIEGTNPASKAEGKNSYIPDLTVAYKLSRDGRYMLRAYRRNQFEVILDGYVVETGIGFVLTMDYDKFRELFRKRKK